MTLLVTGGTGFVMSNVLLDWLTQDPAANAISLDLGPPDSIAERFFAPVRDRLEFVSGDVRDPGVLQALADRPITLLVNGAAITPGVGEREKANAALTVGVNVMGAVNALELARRLPGLRRMIHVSTGSVYGDKGPDGGGPLPEEGYVDPSPRGLYAISKLAAEHVAQRYATLFGLPLHMCRLASVYGPMDRDTPGRVIKCAPNVMMHRALLGTPWTVHAPSGVGDWIQSGDVGRAIGALLRAPKLHHPMYNIAYGEPVSLGALSDLICTVVPGASWREAAKADGADIVGDPKRIGGAWGAYATDRLRSDTGWRPRPLDESLAGYAEWIRLYELV